MATARMTRPGPHLAPRLRRAGLGLWVVLVYAFLLAPVIDRSHDDNHVHQLSWIDLVIANLRGTSLKGAYVYGASLEDANLEGAILEKANLTHVNFVGANLVRADLTGARLRRARLRRANLQGANLQSADLVHAKELDRAVGLDEVESWRGATIDPLKPHYRDETLRTINILCICEMAVMIFHDRAPSVHVFRPSKSLTEHNLVVARIGVQENLNTSWR